MGEKVELSNLADIPSSFIYGKILLNGSRGLFPPPPSPLFPGATRGSSRSLRFSQCEIFVENEGDSPLIREKSSAYIVNF